MPWSELSALIPGTGLSGLVIGLFVWMLRWMREERTDYRVALAAERARAADQENAADAEIADLRRRIADSLTAADGERDRRRESESEAARLAAQLAGLTERLRLATEGKDP